jgi:nucleotide-binding universal stress UspA family protein
MHNPRTVPPDAPVSLTQRLLLPVDGSQCSLRAVQHVIGKARRFGAQAYEIHLVNVQPPLPGGITSFVSRDQVTGYQREESDNALVEARRLLDEAGVRYQAHAEVGPLAETIVRLAESLQCDEIVMGSQGRTALADLLIGSTVTRVVHLTKHPVLLVK